MCHFIIKNNNIFPETIEESSLCKTELLRFSDENNRLKAESLHLKEELSQKEEGAGLTPVISTVKKLVGKLGSDSRDGDEAVHKGDGKYVSFVVVVLTLVVVNLHSG